MTPENNQAFELAKELQKFKYMLNYSFVQAGKILYEIQKTKAYKDLDYRSFTAFLADPEYGMPKSTAYLYITVYKFFVIELGLDENDIMEIDITRLREIIPIIQKGADATEWIHKAKTLGKGDFFNETNEFMGKQNLEIQIAHPDEDEVVVIHTPYIELVKTSPCIICGNRPVDVHHFPQTRGAAGTTNDKAIPLCRGCHIAFHQNPKEFLWTYRVKIMDWFYNLIGVLCEEIRAAQKH